MAALAHAFVRPLLATQCGVVRTNAARVVATAEHGHPDSEAIHDYRVALRRLRTLLKAAAPLFRRKPLARVREGLRELARVAGDVRDEEVLSETLADIELPPATRARVDTWLVARTRRERELRARVIEQLTAGVAAPPTEAPPAASAGAPVEAPRAPKIAVVTEPPRALAGEPLGPVSLPPKPPRISRRPPAPAIPIAELLALTEGLPLRRKAAGISTRALAWSAVQDAAAQTLAEAARPDAASPEAMHRLRIRWKGVRYTGELLSKAIAKEGPVATALEARVKSATRMQKRLGDLHDLDEAIARVARARSLTPGDRMVVHHRLRTARAAAATRLQKELPDALALLDGGDVARRLA